MKGKPPKKMSAEEADVLKLHGCCYNLWKIYTRGYRAITKKSRNRAFQKEKGWRSCSCSGCFASIEKQHALSCNQTYQNSANVQDRKGVLLVLIDEIRPSLYDSKFENPFVKGQKIRLASYDAKSHERHILLNFLKDFEPLEIYGTRIIKRFPKLFDHENSEYIQIVTIKIDEKYYELSASNFIVVDE